MSRSLMLLLALAATPASAWDLGELMHDLALNPGGRARFVETKTIALLDRPVVSSGELLYRPPAHIEKRTLQPKPDSLVLDGDLLSLERGKQKLTLRLSEQPQVLAFVDSLRGTLAGDLAALQRNYKLRLAGSREHWTLDLLPSDQGIAAFVLRITFTGSRERVDSIQYLQADGDRSVMTIEPIEQR